MAATRLDVPPVRAHGERSVYTWAAIVALLFMLAGFAPTYYLKAISGAPELSALKHIHGLVMTAWFTLFLVQVRLVATGRTAMHRQLGVAGIAVALLVVAVGTMVAITAVRLGSAPTGVPPLIFLALPLGEMVIFAVLVTAALLMRKKGAYHKRFMLLATLAMLTPAMARLPLELAKAGGPLMFFALTDLVILACIAFDTARNRRIHPAFAGGFVFIVVGQVGRLALTKTPFWIPFASWLVS